MIKQEEDPVRLTGTIEVGRVVSSRVQSQTTFNFGSSGLYSRSPVTKVAFSSSASVAAKASAYDIEIVAFSRAARRTRLTLVRL